MKKLTLSILFVALTATGALAGSPASQTLRARFEAAKKTHRAEMQAIQMEALLMSEAAGQKKKPDAIADATAENNPEADPRSTAAH